MGNGEPIGVGIGIGSGIGLSYCGTGMPDPVSFATLPPALLELFDESLDVGLGLFVGDHPQVV